MNLYKKRSHIASPSKPITRPVLAEDFQSKGGRLDKTEISSHPLRFQLLPLENSGKLMLALSSFPLIRDKRAPTRSGTTTWISFRISKIFWREYSCEMRIFLYLKCSRFLYDDSLMLIFSSSCSSGVVNPCFLIIFTFIRQWPNNVVELRSELSISLDKLFSRD